MDFFFRNLAIGFFSGIQSRTNRIRIFDPFEEFIGFMLGDSGNTGYSMKTWTVHKHGERMKGIKGEGKKGRRGIRAGQQQRLHSVTE